MTAVIAVCKQECVEVLTDGGYFDQATGNLVGTGGKVWLLPKQNAVLVVTGSVIPGAGMQDMLGLHTSSLDDIEARGADVLRTWYDLFVKQMRMPVPFHALIAGISQRHGPRAFGIRSHDLPANHHDAWVASIETPIWIAPGYDGIAGITVNSFDAEAFDAITDGVKIMEAQRLIPQQVPAGPKGDMQSIVGGFVQHTRVTRAGIETRIVHSWADKVGQRISA